MAGIQSLGIGSGLLTSDLVDQLVKAERAASDLRLDSQSARVEAKISAYGELRTVLEGMQSSISSLSLSSTIQGTSARSSNESVLSATTNSTAEPGTYRVEVDEIAKAHSLATKRFNSIDDTIGTGTLTFKFGTTEYDGSDYEGFTQAENTLVQTLDIDTGNNSLGGIRDAINNGDFGVSASVVYDGTGYRLLLTSEKTGEASSMEITVSGDAGLQALAYNSSQNDPASNMAETQRGSDALVRINGLEVTSTTNTLDQVVRGVSINLAETSTSGVTLSVTRDTAEIADKIENFVEKYNEYKTVYDELVKFNPDDQVGGILLGDNVLRTVQSQLRSGLTQIINGLSGSTYSSLVEIGIRTDQNNDFKLAFDRNKFEAAMNVDARSITGLLATDRQASDAQVRFVTVGADTQPGSYSVEITQAATQAKVQGLTTPGLDFVNPVVISDVNDNFSLNVDGNTRTVSLLQGSYSSGDELALMMQNSINQAFTGQSVSVNFDASNQRFEITSSRFGSNSQVSITSVDPQTANTLGLNVLGGGQAVGSYFSTLSDASFAASSSPGTQALAADEGVNFEANPVGFDLTLTGTSADGTYAISLDENWGDILDTDGNVATARDRSDVLTYIQSQLNSEGLTGVVKAEFNSSDRLVFRTEPTAGSQTLQISNTTVTGSDFLGITDGVAASGVNVAAGTSFELEYENRYGTVSSGLITVPDTVYETAEDLAAAIQAQINADATVAGNAQGAMTEKGSRSLPANFDFDADASQFAFALNGVDFDVTVDAMAGASTLDSIQAAIDSSLVAGGATAGDVVASLSSNGLVLTTNDKGSDEILEIKRDGAGATTTSGSVDLSTGVDFSASPATFNLIVDGTEINVNVNGDGTQGSNDGESNLSVIQQALDTALASAGGGGVFTAGDVVAKLDDSNQLFFETVSKNGVATQATFGARATIEITDADANANSQLGLVNGIGANGFDGFGLAKGVYNGFDSQSTVSYQQDEEGRGRFVIAFDNATNVSLSNVSLTATTQLGFAEGNGAPTTVEKGKDVEGLINGVKGIGRGQLLTASDGNQAATNGYVLGGAGWDFSNAAVIDGSNNTLKVNIDGTESGTITLASGAYASGAQLAAELKSKINADATLLQANKAVDVQYDANTGIFGIFSVSTGSQSSARVTEITAGGVAVFGLTTSSAVVNGKDAVGAKDDASGIVLRVTGDRVGDRGTVNYVEGIMAKLDKFFEYMLGRSGLVTEKESGLKKEEDTIKAERSLLDERTAVFEARLRSKFLFNDKLISQLKTTEDFLVRQFDAMTAANKD